MGSRLGLERVARLCALLGNPQDAVKTVHVAGTNGKGSTAGMIALGLSAAGYRAGLYTSPYIEDARESMSINGVAISCNEFSAMAQAVREQAETLAAEGNAPTSFELETAMAFLWFRECRCDVAVIETGLGGRLDATNVITHPLVSVLTSISWDHVNILGDTLSKIATEKCGIIKPGGITVSYPCQHAEAMDIIRTRAAEQTNRLIMPDADNLRVLNSSLDGIVFEYNGLKLSTRMVGAHQAVNAVTALETLRALNDSCGLSLTDGHIATGIATAALPTRQEVLRRDPILLLDGAHNLDKLTALAETIREHLAGKRIAVVMGMLRDKDFVPSVSLIASLANLFIACAPLSERALPSETVAEIASAHCNDVSVIDDSKAALEEALNHAGRNGAVVVCGSFYLAGPVRKTVASSQ